MIIKINNIDAVEATVETTMAIDQWRKLRAKLRRETYGELGEFQKAISSMVDTTSRRHKDSP